MEKEFDTKENEEWQQITLNKLKGGRWAEMLYIMMEKQPLKDFNEGMKGKTSEMSSCSYNST